MATTEDRARAAGQSDPRRAVVIRAANTADVEAIAAIEAHFESLRVGQTDVQQHSFSEGGEALTGEL